MPRSKIPRKFQVNPGSGGVAGRASLFKKQSSGDNNAAAYGFARSGGGIGGGGGGGGRGDGVVFFGTRFDPDNSDTDILFEEENRKVTFADYKTGVSKTLFGARTGKYYWEVTYVQNVTATLPEETMAGISSTSANVAGWLGNESDEWAFYAKTGEKISNGGGAFEAYGDPYHSNLPKVIGIALDLDSNSGAGIIWFSIDGVWQNGATIGEIGSGDDTNAAYNDIMTDIDPADNVHAAVSCAAAINQAQWRGNFEEDTLVYPAPSGFTAGFGSDVEPPALAPPPAPSPPGDTLVPTAWDPANGGAGITYSNGDLTADWDTGDVNTRGVVTVDGQRISKFYAEITYDSNESTVGEAQIGIWTDTANKNNWCGAGADGWSYYALNGQKINGAVFTAYGSSYGVGDIIGIALDLDNDAIWFSKNGVWQNGATLSEIEAGTTTNAAFTGMRASTLEDIFMGASSSGAGSRPTYTGNFGNTLLLYTVPSGFQEGFGALV